MEQVLEEFLTLLPQLQAKDIGAYAALAMLLVRVWRLPELGLPWPKSKKAGLSVVSLLSLTVTTLGGVVFGGVTPLAAVVSAVPVAVGAVYGHKFTQLLGAIFREVKFDGQVKQPPPHPLTRKLSLKAPLDVVFPPPSSDK